MSIKHNPEKLASRDDEKILRALMLADRDVLRDRASERRLSAEGVAAIRAARQRQAERNQKSKPAIVPPMTKHRRASYG